MGSLKKLHGWYITGDEWLPVTVDVNGKVVLSNIPAHKTSHQNGGSDEIDLTGLSGIEAIPYNGWISAGETWTYASADGPTYTFTISGDKTSKYSAGMRIRLKQGGSYLYFIITVISYSTPNTTITVYGGTDYVLANAAITDNYYSPVKAPLDFPLNPIKWTVKVTDSTERIQVNPVQNTWYNIGTTNEQITIPIGCWNVSYKVNLGAYRDTVGSAYITGTLSTANNSESDTDCSSFTGTGGITSAYAPATIVKTLNIVSKTTYYLNARTVAAGVAGILFPNGMGKMVLLAVCAYL